MTDCLLTDKELNRIVATLYYDTDPTWVSIKTALIEACRTVEQRARAQAQVDMIGVNIEKIV